MPRGLPTTVTTLLAGLAALAALAGCGAGGSDSTGSTGGAADPDPDPVTLALDFTPNAAHAGLYAAVVDGADRANGIELELRAPGGSIDSLKLLVSGRADFAIADIHDLALAAERGADVVAVGAIIQRPLAALIAAGDGIDRPRDLEGRRVGIAGLPSDEAVLRSVVEADGGDPAAIRRVTIGFSAVPALAAGEVDAVVAFWNAEGVALRERGVATREFRVDDFGAPSYPELVLVTTRRTAEEDPDLIARVVATLAEGTDGALGRPGPALEAVSKAAGADAEQTSAEFDALQDAFVPPLELDRKNLEDWAEFDERFGITSGRPDVETLFPR